MHPAASIVIVTYNSAGEIDACLSALSQLPAGFGYEVIVVDNASEDDTVTVVRERFPAIRIVIERENLGFAGGVNRGIEASLGKYIALINPDAVPYPNWLDRMIAPLADAQVGVVGAKVLSAGGRIQSVGASLDQAPMLPAYRGEGEVDVGQYNSPCEVWSVHGAAMAFTRDLWHQLNGFDEGFFPAYLEESDFCERARRAGYKVMTAPQAVVRHKEGSSTGKYSAGFYYYFLRNRLRFFGKWLGWPAMWSKFRPAETSRLRHAPLLDKRVARLVYQAGMPPLRRLDASERAAILTTGQELRARGSPDDALSPLLALLGDARINSVHEEVRFLSRLPLVARFRTAWNSVATRWYIRPNLEQQTRFNLALQRAVEPMLDQFTSQAAAQALETALLAWKLEERSSRSF